jgi:hypothetical protein
MFRGEVGWIFIVGLPSMGGVAEIGVDTSVSKDPERDGAAA